MELTEEQKKAVFSNAPRIVVAAAAGSGKTRCLTQRIARLLEEGVDPTGIVSITFTRTAAEEMKERLSHIPNTADLFIGTIHAFAHKILRVSGDDFTILTDDVDMELHDYLINAYCTHLRYADYLKYRDILAKVELGLTNPSKLEGILAPSARDELSKLHRQKKNGEKYDPDFPETIESLCEQRNIIDFDELLRRTMAYFKTIDAEIDHVLVDEFQDVGNLQYTFIKSLNAKNYFMVGDDFQAIFGFNGGNVDLFKGLMHETEWEHLMLTQNWRSATKIIGAASEIIEQVPDRIDKTVQVMRTDVEGEVHWGRMEDVQAILQDIKESRDYKSWFFLTRSNKDVQALDSMCQANRIPHDTFRRAGLSLTDMRKAMSKNTVKIMTTHMAKGLEATNVLVYGTAFYRRAPSYRSQPEERRVMYVALTRARDNLIILNR